MRTELQACADTWSFSNTIPKGAAELLVDLACFTRIKSHAYSGGEAALLRTAATVLDSLTRTCLVVSDQLPGPFTAANDSPLPFAVHAEIISGLARVSDAFLAPLRAGSGINDQAFGELSTMLRICAHTWAELPILPKVVVETLVTLNCDIEAALEIYPEERVQDVFKVADITNDLIYQVVRPPESRTERGDPGCRM